MTALLLELWRSSLWADLAEWRIALCHHLSPVVAALSIVFRTLKLVNAVRLEVQCLVQSNQTVGEYVRRKLRLKRLMLREKLKRTRLRGKLILARAGLRRKLRRSCRTLGHMLQARRLHLKVAHTVAVRGTSGLLRLRLAGARVRCRLRAWTRAQLRAVAALGLGCVHVSVELFAFTRVAGLLSRVGVRMSVRGLPPLGWLAVHARLLKCSSSRRHEGGSLEFIFGNTLPACA